MIYATDACRYAAPLTRAIDDTVKFTVPGQPLPKARPRFNPKTGRAYTPAPTKAWEHNVGTVASMAMRGEDPMRGSVRVVLAFRREKRYKADTDNLIKGVLDGMNRIVYMDDQQVRDVRATVEYGSDNPGVDVEVRAA